VESCSVGQRDSIDINQSMKFRNQWLNRGDRLLSLVIHESVLYNDQS
jgi:hypothetical protein